MALEQRLNLRMAQRLVMTPSLQQAIKLLQLSKLELAEEIAQELVENPVLEEQDEIEVRDQAASASGVETEAAARTDAPAANEPEAPSESDHDPIDEIDLDAY